MFYTHRHNTSFSLTLLSLSFLFLLSFLSPLFSFFPPFSFLSLSLQIFGAATAAMPHRFRRACTHILRLTMKKVLLSVFAVGHCSQVTIEVIPLGDLCTRFIIYSLGKWLHDWISYSNNWSKETQETHTAYSTSTQYLNEKQHTWLHRH